MVVLSPELEAMLGTEEAEIVKAIDQGFGDLESIHFVTGIAVPCIERKLGALVAMGLVTGTDGTYKAGERTNPSTSPFESRGAERGATRASAGRKAKRVLVVDDEPDIRLFMRMILEKHGYLVLEASNGQSALELLESQEAGGVSCVITDYLMPHMNGLELCDELRKHHECNYIVFLMTAYLDKARFEAARCFDEKFMKPLDFVDLISRLELHVA
jgi:CheY-like chemotaxis protein